MAKPNINILITDDHPFFRSAIASILSLQIYVNEIFEAGTGVECLDQLDKHAVDVVLLDINMPDMDGIECLKRIKANRENATHKQVKVIVLTQHSDAKFYRALMSMGAKGYLLKSTTEDQFISDFERVVFDDESVLSSELNLDEKRAENNQDELFTPREREILVLIIAEVSVQEIAKRLYISTHTVYNHRKSILHKTNQESVAGLMKWAVTNKVV
jgi:DNA-binding NarL/FixJ family response regulator